MNERDNTNPIFSIMIPSWNNIKYLKLCVDSIRKNSSFTHQILVFVNEGTDGTLNWVKSEGIEHIHSAVNVGICYALNSLRSLVSSDYIVYMNDDMYACPRWDEFLWEEISSLPDNNFFLSSTMIQPSTSTSKCMINGTDYGRNVEEFDEKRLLADYDNVKCEDWKGATWPPNIIHRSLWDLVGGYSIEFSPGMYSDPDFSAKLWLAGVRYFKGVSKSRVYHFECKSTNRIKKNNGSAQFLFKYGITASTFGKYFLQSGEKFSNHDSLNLQNKVFTLNLIRARIKRVLYLGRIFIIQKIWQ